MNFIDKGKPVRLEADYRTTKGYKEDSTYIGMVADLLDHVRVEVTGIALETLADGEGVLHTAKHLSNEVVDEASLAKLKILVILLVTILMNGLNPVVVVVDS